VRSRRTPTGPTPGTHEARFPGFDVLAQRATWDEVTEHVVVARLQTRPLRFFDEAEALTAGALLDRLLGQDDEPRVPVLGMIDERLADGIGDGYRYDEMPEDADAWRRSIAALDRDAEREHGVPFHALGRGSQMDAIERVQQTDGSWADLPAKRVFELWVRYACAAFYSHPWAWNEIGFGGPAYPRGYANLGVDKRERWEAAEVDASDPVPWSQRADAAKRAHASREPQP
jgi:hypothetical protein